jgi:hypothetical protein
MHDCVAQGCQWAIGGLHDQGWQERPIFGKIRFMNYKGCQRKFDIPSYVRRIGDLDGSGATGGGAGGRAAVATKATKSTKSTKKHKAQMPSISAPPKKKAKKVKAKAVDLF